MEITAKMVAELRARTGLPMMKCKKALVEADGDIETAIDNLRKEGEKTIGKLSSREMKEGLVFTHQDDAGAAAVSILCETEPVATSAPIGEFGGMLVKDIYAKAPADTGTGADIADLELSDGRKVSAVLDEFVGSTIRENMKIGAFARFKPSNGVVSVYVHHNKKVAVLVELEGEGLAAHDAIGELGNDLGMHIAWNSDVQSLTRDGIDPEWIAKEREIFMAQVENMPEDKREKIAEGKLSKRLKDVVLLEQPFVKNQSESVQQHVEAVGKQIGTKVAIKRFARIAAGA
jgi:elongation factor Ts